MVGIHSVWSTAVIVGLALGASTAHWENAQELRLPLNENGVTLFINLIDPAGNPIAEELVGTWDHLRDWGPTNYPQKDRHLKSWPDTPTPIVIPCTQTARGLVATDRSLSNQVIDGTNFAVQLQPSHKYLVGIQGPGFDGELQIIEAPISARTVELTVKAVRNLKLGKVRVHVGDNDQQLSRGFTSRSAVNLAIEDVSTGAVLVAPPYTLEELPFTYELPVGSYRVSAEREGGFGWHGNLQAPRVLGRAEAGVLVKPNQQTEVHLDLQPGARLQVSLSGLSNTADRAVTDATLERCQRQLNGRDPKVTTYHILRNGYDPQRAASRARLNLVSAGHRNIPVQWGNTHLSWGVYGGYGVGPRMDSEWPLGETITSEVVPTGSYLLVARLPGGRELSVPVVLCESKTTMVDLRFPDSTSK